MKQILQSLQGKSFQLLSRTKVASSDELDARLGRVLKPCVPGPAVSSPVTSGILLRRSYSQTVHNVAEPLLSKHRLTIAAIKGAQLFVAIVFLVLLHVIGGPLIAWGSVALAEMVPSLTPVILHEWQHPLSLYVFLGYFACLFLLWTLPATTLLMADIYFYPATLELDPRGFRFKPADLPGFSIKSPWVPWSVVTKAETVSYHWYAIPRQALEITLDNASVPATTWWLIRLMCPSISVNLLNRKRSTIRIDLECILKPADREVLGLWLRRQLPAQMVEASHLSLIGAEMPSASYTDLWLTDLSEGRRNTRSLEPGQLLAHGKYRINKHLATGGHATIYSAIAVQQNDYTKSSQPEEVLGRVNLGDESRDINLHPDQDDGSHQSGRASDVILKEFILPIDGGFTARKKALEFVGRESDLLRKLNHPHIVKLLDYFVESQRAYLVLPLIEGQTLRQWIARSGPAGEPQVVNLAKQMCGILLYLHSRTPAVVHRDFTPDNLILSPDGTLSLIDFNVAQDLDAQTTRTVVGKHSYIPPEQFRGRSTPQSDLYAMGASLYYLLTGKDPEPMSRSLPQEHARIISADLNAFVGDLTEPDAASRLPDVDTAIARLDRIESSAGCSGPGRNLDAE